MSIFDKFNSIVAVQKELESANVAPFGAVTEKLFSATDGIVNGYRVILAGTNNYLGLTLDPECIDAACNATKEFGTGTTGSRMANGTYAGHRELERELADFYDCNSAIVFSTGYLATMGMTATLAGPGDVIVLDADSHASIYDGCRMGGADIVRFRHNDVEHLEKQLRRLGERASNALIIAEGIYSMLGDVAPLAEIAELKRRYGGYLLVDEAHSLGICGESGRGVCEEAGIEDDVDFIVGTFSKSLGATGGFCVSRRPELEVIRYALRSYIFTASPSPSVIASTRAALRLLQQKPELRTRLWKNAHQLYDGLKSAGFNVGPKASPVVAAFLDNKQQALSYWNTLLENGVYVNLILPPASPGDSCMLRCSVSAAHTEEQISHIIRSFSALLETSIDSQAKSSG